MEIGLTSNLCAHARSNRIKSMLDEEFRNLQPVCACEEQRSCSLRDPVGPSLQPVCACEEQPLHSVQAGRGFTLQPVCACEEQLSATLQCPRLEASNLCAHARSNSSGP